MTLEQLFGPIVAGLALFLIVLALRHIVPILRNHLGKAIPYLWGVARRAFSRAGSILNDGGRLSGREAISQVAGMIVMLAAGGVFAVSDLTLTLATLGPFFGITVDLTQGVFARFDQLLGFSVVVLALVFGLILTDLLCWTSLTKFALIDRSRAGAFCVAGLCFVGSLGLAIALAAYRVPALASGDVGVEPNLVWMQGLPAFILFSLAGLLFIGVAVTMMGLETFFAAVSALVVAAAGATMALLSVILRGVDLMAEIYEAVFTAAKEASGSLKQSAGAASGAVNGKIARFGEKLANLVRPRPKPPALRLAPAFSSTDRDLESAREVEKDRCAQLPQ